MALLPDHWRELEAQLDQLLDATTTHRPTLLAGFSAMDPERGRALEHLLVECERPMPLLDKSAAERFADLVGDSPMLEPGSVLGDRYEIRREVGRGGMAGVYLAEDRRHARSVAVKIVRPELAASMGRDRFLREIAIVAGMRHPNIMPLFDSGDANGLLYFIMPFEEGPSLRRRLAAAPPLTVAETLGILGDVAKALAYAHERGVVHRDIKPDNVMLSGGTAVVADFGIAKAVSSARNSATDRTLTQAGAGIGTAAYMAPEQAVGDPSTDHRCDIYAFGCVAYELFTGAPPFAGESSFEIITAHLTQTPASLGSRRPDVPPAISDLVDRCLRKDPALRPQSATELLGVLTNPVSARAPATRRARAFVGLAVLAGFAGLVAVKTIRDRAGRQNPAAARTDNTPGGRTLVVLPMENRTGDSTQSYLAAGLAEDIGKRLEGIGGIRLRSGARSDWPTATRPDLDAIGAQFGSTILLRTTLNSFGDSLAVDAAVVDLETGAEKVIARRRFASSGIADAETDLAARIASAIFKAPLPADPQRSLKPIDPESYRLMLAGWHILMSLHLQDSARALFQRAVDIDPGNARAWSGLSSTWAILTTADRVSFEEGYAQTEAAARHALELDPRQGSALANLGFFQARRYNSMAIGMKAIDSAIAVDPGNAEVFIVKSALYKNAWQWDEARKASRFAEELDPMSVPYLGADAQNEMCAGQYETARSIYERGLSRQPSSVEMRRGLVRALAALGKYDDAIRAWAIQAAEARDSVMLKRLSTARGARGYWDAKHLEGRQRLDRLKRSKGYVSRRLLMMARFGAGDFEDGYRDLERLTAPDAQAAIYRMPCMPDFDEIRNTPRFKSTLARTGPLPP